MFGTTKRLIKLAIVGGAAYSVYKARPEETKALMDKILPESIKKEIKRTREQYETMVELKEATKGFTSEMGEVATKAVDQLFSNFQNPEVQEQLEELARIRESAQKGETAVKDTFTEEEVKKLMSELADDKMGWAIRVMLFTGMTMYEILALTSDDIEGDGSVIHVKSEVRTKAGEPVLKSLTKSMIRDVAVPANVRKYSKKLANCSSGYIFYGKGDRITILPSEFTEQFKDHIGEVPQVRIFGPRVAVNTYQANNS